MHVAIKAWLYITWLLIIVCLRKYDEALLVLTSKSSMQMAFKGNGHGTEGILDVHHQMSTAEQSFKFTRECYEASQLCAGSTGPFERVMQSSINGCKAVLCDRCGIGGGGLKFQYQWCLSCLQPDVETVSHLSCIDRNELRWILGNEDEHHWRCKKCRYGILHEMLLQDRAHHT